MFTCDTALHVRAVWYTIGSRLKMEMYSVTNSAWPALLNFHNARLMLRDRQPPWKGFVYFLIKIHQIGTPYAPTDMHTDSPLFCIFRLYVNDLLRGKCVLFRIHQTAISLLSRRALFLPFSFKCRRPRLVSQRPGETLIDKSIDMRPQQPRWLRWSYNRSI